MDLLRVAFTFIYDVDVFYSWGNMRIFRLGGIRTFHFFNFDHLICRFPGDHYLLLLREGELRLSILLFNVRRGHVDHIFHTLLHQQPHVRLQDQHICSSSWNICEHILHWVTTFQNVQRCHSAFRAQQKKKKYFKLQ